MYDEDLICPACGEEMTFVGDYLVACQNPECEEFQIEYDIDGEYGEEDNEEGIQ